MSAAERLSFNAAMIQMRSGLDPAANLAAALDLIDEAKEAGADYVLTPEMTNILAAKREQLFAKIVAEDLARSSAQARDLHPYRLARDQGIAGKSRKPLVSDRPARRGGRALRQD